MLFFHDPKDSELLMNNPSFFKSLLDEYPVSTLGVSVYEPHEVKKIISALGPRFCGLHDNMPAHSPRDAVIECANAAREAEADLLITFGGGSVTDGGKAVTICLEHGITDIDGLEPYRTTVDETGKRHFPQYGSPRVRQIAIPTTLSGGEFNARAGVTEPR